MTPGKVLKAHIDDSRLSYCGQVQSFVAFLQQELLGFFFKPVQLHLELSDLAMEFRLHLFVVLLSALAAVRKRLRQLLKQFLPSLADLVGVDTVFPSDLE